MPIHINFIIFSESRQTDRQTDTHTHTQTVFILHVRDTRRRDQMLR